MVMYNQHKHQCWFTRPVAWPVMRCYNKYMYLVAAKYMRFNMV